MKLIDLLAPLLLLACGGTTEPTELPTPSGQDEPAAAATPADPPPPAQSSTNDACEGTAYVADVPRWQRAGSNPQGYEMSPDESRAACEKPGAHVRSLAGAKADQFGTYMDTISAAAYRGKRVRLRGVVETANVTGWTGLWLRVDDANAKMLAFDNMGKRRLVGTLAPAAQSVVLDVPNEAVHLAFGVLVSGSGEVWTSEVVIEIVGIDVPTTS